MTTPQGLIQWGQSGIYNAVEDREVIRAVTRMRTGLVWPAVLRTGSGLQIIIEGGWLGVADCGDRSSCVVGSRLDQVVSAVPGPATGTRTDVLWCDVFPDDAMWRLVVVPQSETVNRPGIPLAWITVPAGATLASQLGIRNADASLERRILHHQARTDTRTSSGTTWSTADTVAWSLGVEIEPGQWYRVVFDANSCMAVSGTLEGRIGVGWHLMGTSDDTSVLERASVISYARLNAATHARVEYIFRHPVNAPMSYRQWDGRIWAAGNGSYRQNALGGTQGPGLVITVEDIGS